MRYIKLKVEARKTPGKMLTICAPLWDREFEKLAWESTEGFCVHCGAQASGVEPDARRYKCEDCGENRVYGLEELLLRGCVVTRDPKPDETVYEA
jgi:DNA-directed RNA polymerase subunit RPC12/RpoP